MMVLGLMIALVATDAQAWGKKKKPAPAPVAPTPAEVAPPPPPPPPQVIYSGDPAVAPQVAPADLMTSVSTEVQAVAQWVKASRDNGNMNFLVLDKTNAQVFVFNSLSQLVATAPVLLGMGKGDRMLVPDTAPLAAIPPQKRITPAGRFVSRLGKDNHGKELLVLDYAAALSLHPVVKGTPKEQRAVRLGSPTSEDNRISFGCINVPAAFYSNVVSPMLTNTMGVVYILPETMPAGQYFGFQPTAAPGTVASPAIPAAAPPVPATVGVEAAQVSTVPGAK
jgi:hypothetical protein